MAEATPPADSIDAGEDGVKKGLIDGPWSTTEHGKKAEMKLEKNPCDVESWSILIREAQSTSITRARTIYDRLVTQFPTCGRYWRLYIEQEMKSRNYEQVEKLFQKCLMNILHIDLWKCYIAYVRETKSPLPTFREKMRQTYDFALEHVGIDYHATAIWQEYIQFMKSEDAQGTFAENQKIQAVRKAYQQAVVIPMMNVEQIWRDYNTFEQGVNKNTAKKLVESISRQYMNAKRASHEYEGVIRGLNRSNISVPLVGSVQELQQLQLWKNFVAWEKRNPLRTENKSLLVKRVMYAYEQSLLCFGYSPDLWYEAAAYLQRASESGDSQFSQKWLEDSASMFDRAVSGPLKHNLLLHFAYADFEEARLKFDKAEAIYKKLLDIQELDPSLVYIHYMKFCRHTEGMKAARLVFKRAREDSRTKYQVFIAAALMEYYISKDKTIAYKIFELGLKRYGDDPAYVLSYLDHLSHLNEENNTRVLFEKALTSMPVDKTSDIWDRFVEFESFVGDLTSVLKVEKRKAAALKTEDNQSRDTILLVDRYKYLHLLPCSVVDLKLMNHPGHKHQDGAAKVPSSTTLSNGVSGGSVNDMGFVKPDTTQMKPFKPSAISGVGMNAVPGGYFPLPMACASLLSRLPPPECFQGPFVKLEELVQTIDTCVIPEHFAPAQPLETTRGAKRKLADGDGEESDDEEGLAPPINDLYRSRQQKRTNTNAP